MGRKFQAAGGFAGQQSRHVSHALQLALSCLAIASLAGCGTDPASPGMTGGGLTGCMPGAVVSCACPGGVTSTQTCDATGAAYSVCACGGFGSAGAGAAGVGIGTAGVGAAGVGFAGVGAAGVGIGTAGVGAAGVNGTAGVGTAGTGTAGTGTAGTGTAGTGVTVGGSEPKIPTVSATCPQLKTGTVQVLGQNVQLWVGAKQAGKKGPLMFYWHGTGGQSTEAVGGLGSALTEIQAEGGMVASFSTSTKKGQSTANNVWYTGDFEMTDILVKCAVEQLDIDTRRIYSAGCSAGGLQAGAMVTGRASYLAAVMPNSGGIITFFAPPSDNPNNVPAVMAAHGGSGDNVGVNFGDTSADLEAAVVAAGGFAVDCEHSMGHCGSPSAVRAAQWEFLKAHPFGVDPEPYAGGLPSSFPSICKIVQ
jgi:hypothetical protein